MDEWHVRRWEARSLRYKVTTYLTLAVMLAFIGLCLYGLITQPDVTQ